MRYRLERSTKGQITQCENKADGGNVYAKRKEINETNTREAWWSF
jgi:hypothetical protein